MRLSRKNLLEKLKLPDGRTIAKLNNKITTKGDGKVTYALKSIELSDGTVLEKKYAKPATDISKKMLGDEYRSNAKDIKAAQTFVNEFFKNIAKQDLDADTKAMLIATLNDGTGNALRSAARVWGRSIVMQYADPKKYRLRTLYQLEWFYLTYMNIT